MEEKCNKQILDRNKFTKRQYKFLKRFMLVFSIEDEEGLNEWLDKWRKGIKVENLDRSNVDDFAKFIKNIFRILIKKVEEEEKNHEIQKVTCRN